MEDKFKTLFFAFVFMSVLGILIFTFVTEMANTYNKDINEVQNQYVDLNTFNDSIKDFYSNAKVYQSKASNFSNKNGLEKLADIMGLFTFDLWNLGFSLLEFMLSPIDIVGAVLVGIFGLPAELQIIIDVVLGILIFSVIFAIWRYSKVGD